MIIYHLYRMPSNKEDAAGLTWNSHTRVVHAEDNLLAMFCPFFVVTVSFSYQSPQDFLQQFR